MERYPMKASQIAPSVSNTNHSSFSILVNLGRDVVDCEATCETVTLTRERRASWKVPETSVSTGI